MNLFLFLFLASFTAFAAPQDEKECSIGQSQQLKTFFSAIASNERYSGIQTEKKLIRGKEVTVKGEGEYDIYYDEDEFEVDGGWCSPDRKCNHVWFKFEIVSGCLHYWGEEVKVTKITPTELSYLAQEADGTQSKVRLRLSERSYFEYDVNYLKKGKSVGSLSFKGKP